MKTWHVNNRVNTLSIGLEGKWQCVFGEAPSTEYAHEVHLPGSVQDQGLGEEVTSGTPWTGQIVDRSWYTAEKYAPYREPNPVKIPFWLQPERHFIGVVWYRRDVEIPEAWRGKRIVLRLERAHIATSAVLDGVETSRQTSLAAPHVHDFGTAVRPGRHELILRVDNRLPVDVGTNSHSVTDHTQTNWNGVIGEIALQATSPVWIEDAQVIPDFGRRELLVRVTIGNVGGKSGRGVLTVDGVGREVAWEIDGGFVEVRLPILDGAGLWDEFRPNLRRMEVRLQGDDAEDARSITYGLRETGVDGTQFTLNGRKIFLRGTIDGAIFPLTGYPPMDKEAWERIFRLLRDYGFNHVRFHSWCPPEAAFQAADEAGFYLQVECSSWANSTTGLGVGDPIDDWLYDEARAILKAFGNHPSFLFMAYGNEPGGNFREYLGQWVAHWKREDPRRWHTSAAGWPALPENDFHNIPDPRLQVWAEGGTSRLNALPPSTDFDYRIHVAAHTKPLVAHESGQWCAYPNFEEIDKYRGVLKAKNFEIFRASLEANHMGGLARNFVEASGRLQVICYREEIEAALRTEGLGGFQLLQANDFPGQGTAPVGWFDAFWDEKGYTSAAEFRRFNAPIVLLARLPRRIFSRDETFEAAVEIAHFGERDLEGAVIAWEIVDGDGQSLASGTWEHASIPIGNGRKLGTVRQPLEVFEAPGKFRLVTHLRDHGVENSWEFWVYPLEGTIEPDYTATPRIATLRPEMNLERAFAKGGSILVLANGSTMTAPRAGLGFTTIFWNTAWTSGQLPHTLGLHCDPSHPAFASFPTEHHTNWQWWELLRGATPLVLDPLPPEVLPIVQVIDDWNKNRRLGLLFEARVGKASVMFCGMDLFGSLPWRHAARQFRKSLLDYMTSDDFAPKIELTPEQVCSLWDASFATRPRSLPAHL